MTNVHLELQTLPGFAAGLGLGALHYGLIVHERVVWNGTDTREKVDFLPLLDEKGSPAEIRGLTPDVARMAQERGEEGLLDLTLVRSSALRLAVDAVRPFGRTTVQRAFVAVLAGATRLSPKLGLALHARIGDREFRIPCADTGSAPLCIWRTAEWEAHDKLAPPGSINDLPAYLAQLEGDAQRLASAGETERGIDAAIPPPVPTPAPTAGANAASASGDSAPYGMRRWIEAMQNAAAAALEEVACGDPGEFTRAVLLRVPADLRRRTQGVVFSAHAAGVDLAQTFSRPDFISARLPSRDVWLLPNPAVSYAYMHARHYSGADWPRVLQPALCSIDPAGRAVLLSKGRLA